MDPPRAEVVVAQGARDSGGRCRAQFALAGRTPLPLGHGESSEEWPGARRGVARCAMTRIIAPSYRLR